MTFTLDTATIKTIALAEAITHAHVKDCMVSDDRILFIVEEEDIGMAIGKHHANVKRLEQMLKKKVRMVAFSNDVVQFIKNMVFPLEIEKKEEREGVLFLTGEDTQTRAMLIGRGATNLRALEEVVKRYFPVKEIRVVAPGE